MRPHLAAHRDLSTWYAGKPVVADHCRRRPAAIGGERQAEPSSRGDRCGLHHRRRRAGGCRLQPADVQSFIGRVRLLRHCRVPRDGVRARLGRLGDSSLIGDSSLVGRARHSAETRPRFLRDYDTLRAVSSTTKDVCNETSSTARNFTVMVWPACEATLKDFRE